MPKRDKQTIKRLLTPVVLLLSFVAMAVPATPVLAAPRLTVKTTTLPASTVGVAYSQILAATGGAKPYTWSVIAGALPAGLTLNATTGAISGTPIIAATSNFTVRVTDKEKATDTTALSITINRDLTITTTTVPSGTVGAAYNQTLGASGGTAPLTWSVIAGTLPGGLTLNAATGVISGTPATAATSNFTVRVMDSVTAKATQAFSITINAALIITTTTLPVGMVGAAYNQALATTGGTAPLTWSVIASTLPAGLTLDSATGVISGTPTIAATANFTVQVRDNVTATATAALSITINMPPPALSLTTTTMPAGTVGVAYGHTLAATGGMAPYTWSVVLGALPGGLRLDPASGVISGIPGAAGISSFTVQIADAGTGKATRLLSIAINVAVTGGGGSGGFGGGGTGGIPPAPGVTNVTPYTNDEGLFNLAALVKSEDGRVNLSINKGVRAHTRDGQPLRSIKILPMDNADNLPVVPTNSKLVGPRYEMTPDGAIFSPSISLTIFYDSAELPQDVDIDSLSIRVLNQKELRWDIVTSSQNKAESSVTAQVEQFSVYALLGEIAVPPPPPAPPPPATLPAPAKFSVSDVTITPSSCTKGQQVTVSAKANNTGGTSGQYDVILTVNGEANDIRRVSVDAGDTASVTFTVSTTTPGTYEIDVNGSKASLVVEEFRLPMTVRPESTYRQNPLPERVPFRAFVVVLVMGVILIGGAICYVLLRNAVPSRLPY